MVVLAGRRFRRQHAQAARHAEVQDEVAVAAIDQQILAAPAHARRRCARRARARRAAPASAAAARAPTTPLIMRPASCGARPRRVTSTSGSSGMGKCFREAKCACAGHQIYLRWIASPWQNDSSPRAALSLACGLAFAAGADPQQPPISASRRSTNSCSARSPCSAATWRSPRKTYLDLAKRTARRAHRAPRGRSGEPGAAARARARGGAHLARARAGLGARAAGAGARCWSSAKRVDEAEPGAGEAARRRGREPRERVHAAEPPARRQPGQGGQPARGPQPGGEAPAAAAGALRGRRRPPPSPATMPRRSTPSRQALRAAPGLGARGDASRRRCCRRARRPRRRSASASSSRRIPTAREARLNYARVLVLDKRLPEARKQFEALLARQSAATPK